MIPEITQDAPGSAEQFWCASCGAPLPAPDRTAMPPRQCCPSCGEPAEYEKAVHVIWRKRECAHCGRLLSYRANTKFSIFVTTLDYVRGVSLCRDCLEEHCAQTNCLQCDIGQWPNCRYAFIKQHVTQSSKGTEGSGDPDA